MEILALPPTIPEPQLLQAGLWSLGWAGLSPLSCPLCPFSCITPISASNCVPRACSKVPGSNLPWGGSGDRVRLVNSAGVSSRWEGTLGTEAQRSHVQRGHGKGPTQWLPAQLPRLLCVALWAFASSFLLLLLLCLVLTVGPASCLWWKGQPFIVGLLCSSNCAYT